jgi:hypothetical protein
MWTTAETGADNDAFPTHEGLPLNLGAGDGLPDGPAARLDDDAQE